MAGLEFFLPTVLAEIYPEWKGESLDGILSHVVRKTGENEADILGLCYLMSDQTLTPIHVRLQLSKTIDHISWLALKLGEMARGRMVRIPHASSPSIDKRLHALGQRADSIEWAYMATYGEQGSETVPCLIESIIIRT